MALCLAVLSCLAVSMTAQDNDPPVVKLAFAAKSGPAGSKLKGTLTVTFAEGLHGYQNPPLSEYQIPVKVAGEDKGIVLKVAYPKGQVKGVAGEQAAVYEGTIKIPIEITLPKKVGAFKPKLSLSYQQCTESACYPPGKVLVEGSITVTKAVKG